MRLPARHALSASKTTLKRRAAFLQFREQVVANAPPERELPVILKNDCIHKKCDDWLAQTPNEHVHFTPTSASRLHLAEPWSGIMPRKALRGASFRSVAELNETIDAVHRPLQPDRPALQMAPARGKRAQLRIALVNLCNWALGARARLLPGGYRADARDFLS